MRAFTWITLLLLVAGCQGASTPQNGPQDALLSAPSGLVATAGDGQVVLKWNVVEGATRYRVFQGMDPGLLTQATEVTQTTATLTGLSNGALYYFTVASASDQGASDQSAPISATPRPTSLVVQGTSPNSGAISVRRDQVLEFAFLDNIDPASIQFSSSPDQAFTLQASGQPSFELVPQGLLKANTQYAVTIRARSVEGLEMSAPYTLTFTTSDTPQTVEEISPTVTGVDPEPGATDINEAATVTVYFSKPMDQASTQAAFSISPSVSCTFFWSSSEELTCHPQAPLTLDTQYTVTVGTGAKSADSGALPLEVAFSSVFHTRPPDTTPPTLVSFTPAEGAKGQERSQEVVLHFSEAMDCESVKSAFTWVSPARGVGTFSSCSSDGTATLEPETPFAYGDQVTWTLGASAADTSGNPLGAAQTHTFTVAHVANQQLKGVASLDGYAGSLGQFDSSATTMKMGATGANNEELRGFVDFDLSALPSDTVRVAQATMTLTETGTTGDPFGKLGSLQALKLDYGSGLEQTDFSAPGDTRLECVFPFICYDVADDTEVASSSTLGPVTLDVSPEIAGAFQERDSRSSRAQFRLHFVSPQNADGGTDVVQFATGEAAVGAPVLDVTYEYP